MAQGTIDRLRTDFRAHDAAVAQGLVRKTVPTEALVVSWREISETTQAVTVRWPDTHDFYIESNRYSPLLVIESIRQALALLTNTVHGIPLGHRLGWEHIHFTVDPRALYTTAGPVEVELMVTHTSVNRRRFGSVHLASRIVALRGNEHLGSAELRYTTHPQAIYERLRGPYADAVEAFGRALPTTPPVPPSRVGRSALRNVVLSPAPTAHTWQLRVDTGHSVLFDHPHDHVPGMVLLEAAGQAAQAEVMPRPAVPVSFDTVFLRYVEFDRPCLLDAERLDPDAEGRPRVRISAFQAGRLAFTSTVTAEPAAPH